VEFRHFVFFIYFDMWFLDILGYRKWNPHLITLLHNARNMDGEQKVLTLFPWTKWKHQWNALENLDWGSNRSCRKDWMAETYSGNNSWDKYGGHCRKKTNVPFRIPHLASHAEIIGIKMFPFDLWNKPVIIGWFCYLVTFCGIPLELPSFQTHNENALNTSEVLLG
jgi:hypothetical protein